MKLLHLPTSVLLLTAALLTGCATVKIDPAVRETAEKRWAKELEAFAAEDAKSPPQPGGMLFVGSSSFRMWKDVAGSFPERRVINRGFGGSQMHELLALTDHLVWPYEPSEILVYEGDNDIAAKKTPAQIATEFEQFTRLVHRRLPRATIHFVSIKPSPSRAHLLGVAKEANELVAAYCESRSWLQYIDVVAPMLDASGQPRGEIFGPDNLHMNPAGYALWTEVIRRELGLPALKK